MAPVKQGRKCAQASYSFPRLQNGGHDGTPSPEPNQLPALYACSMDDNFQPPTERELTGPPPALVVHDRGRGYREDQAWADREREARELWTRGILDPAAPGVVYWPSVSELSHRTELTGSHIERLRKAGDWDAARDRNMAALQVSHMTTVEVSEQAVERAERLSEGLRKADDRAFELSEQGMEVAGMMLAKMAEAGAGDPNKLHKLASTIETFHRVARAAYNPAVADATNNTTVNLSVNTITASEELVASVANVYLELEKQAQVKEEKRRIIQGECEL